MKYVKSVDGKYVSQYVEVVEDQVRLSAIPLVSVSIVTYNHERFIRQAIESVLAQKVNFGIEIVVKDDKSVDSTRDILLEYQTRYPSIIRLWLCRENCYSQRISLAPDHYGASRGKYIALLDGDDYWTDPLKLQMQVDCLDKDPALSLVYHNVEYRFEGEEGRNILAFPSDGMPGGMPSAPATTTFLDILKGRSIPTLSIVCRREFLCELPSWVSQDWSIIHYLLKQGNAQYLDRVMGVYRQHAGGVWSHSDPVQMTKDVIKAKAFLLDHISLQKDEKREVHHGVWIQVLHCVEKLIREHRSSAALSVMHDYAWRFPFQALTQLYCYHLWAKAFGQTIVKKSGFGKSVQGKDQYG